MKKGNNLWKEGIAKTSINNIWDPITNVTKILFVESIKRKFNLKI